jgi:hypothetical protein
VESGVTDFSPEVRCIQEAVRYLLDAARRYRKDRQGLLRPEDPEPVLPEGWVRGDDEAGVRAWHEEYYGREWPEELQWPDEECPPQFSERRILEQLASGGHGALNYKIWMSSSGDGQRQRPSRPRRLRPPRVLPSGRPSLLLSVYQRAHAGPHTSPPAQPDVTRRKQELRQQIVHLKRREDSALIADGRWEEAVAHGIADRWWEKAAAYWQERRGLHQELRTLEASLHTPPQGLQDTVACKHVTITVGLGEMSQQEQRRWRKKLRHSPPTTWLAAFRKYLCMHPQMGRNPIYIDVYTTTKDDLTIQVLAYVFQAEIVSWDAIEPWVKHYAASWGQETEEACWRNYESGRWCEAMLAFALPQEANALRPPSPPRVEPGAYSIPQAAKVLGITERQLRYMIEHEEIPGIERDGRRRVILADALEHLRPQVVAKGRRRQDQPRRAMFIEKAKNEYGMTSDAIRQMIHRGPRTPERTPDWNALDAQLTHHSRRAKGQEPSEDTMSADDLEGLRTLLETQSCAAQTEDERLEILDKLTYIRQRQQKGAS